MLFANLIFGSGLVAALTTYRVADAGAKDISLAMGGNASAIQTPNFTFEELYGLQKNFLDHFIYPANVKEVSSFPWLPRRPSETDLT